MLSIDELKYHYIKPFIKLFDERKTFKSNTNNTYWVGFVQNNDGSLTIWSMKFSNSIANEYELRNTYINDFIKDLIKKL